MTKKRKTTRISGKRRKLLAIANDPAQMERLAERVHERVRQAQETPEPPERPLGDCFTDPDALLSPLARAWME